MKRRNPTWGCPRIAQQIALAFGIPMNKDVVRRILAVRYQPRPDASGAHLVALAGMLAANGRSNDPDIVNRESAALQCLVLRATPTDLAHFEGGGLPNVVSFMRELPSENVYADASPIAHVSSAAPPTLLIHGDADKTVSYQQSVAFKTKLEQAHVPVKLITIPGGDHGPDFGARGKPHPDWPDYAGETLRWFDQHLQPRRSSQ
jgi:fermentation-respiration switch protein FrsA (DUF1100 family)